MDNITGKVVLYAHADPEKDEYDYTVTGEKNDIKNVLFSIMGEDVIFASLCAIAAIDFAKSLNLSIEELADFQTKQD